MGWRTGRPNSGCVKSGKLPAWERIGNAYRLELFGRCALIEDLVDEDSPAQEFTLDEFSRAVKAWIERNISR